MAKKFYIISLCVICVLSNDYAQNNSSLKILKQNLAAATDDHQRVELYLKISASYFIPDASLMVQYARQALTLATRLNEKNEILADCHYYIGQGLRRMDKNADAIEHLKEADSLYKKSGNENKIATAEQELSVNYYYMGKYDEALEFANKALSKYELIKNDSGKAEILTHLGYTYQSKLNYVKALQCFSESLQLSERLNLRFNHSENLIAIGMYYLQRKEFENAKLYYNQAIALLDTGEGVVILARYKSVLGLIEKNLGNYDQSFKELQFSIKVLAAHNDYHSMCFAYQNMGDLFNTLNKPAEALQYEVKALNAFYSAQDEEGIAEQNFIVGHTFFILKNNDSAFFYLQKGLQLAEEKKFRNVKRNCYEYLAKLSVLLNDYQNAFIYQTKFLQEKDTLADIEAKNKLIEFQTQFETERKEKEIALLKKDQQLSKESLERQKTFQYAAYIIVFLLVLIGFLIINRYRSVQRAKRIIEIEQMRNNIARNLHDDIGSTLTSINILSKVALQQTGTNTAANSNMQKIKDRSSIIMESMNDIVWAINPSNDALDKIILRMKEFGSEMLEQAGIKYTFTEEGELSNSKLSLAQRNNLYLIFKEALNNTIKYSEATEVDIILKRDQSKLILKITDNGKGFDTHEQFSGNGLKNMHSRANAMKSFFELQSMPGNGTSVNLVVSVP